MQILFDLGPEFRKTITDFDAMGKDLRAAAHDGLAEGVELAAAHVVENYLTGQYLKRRTGNLAKAVAGWMAGPLDGVVGVAADSAVESYLYQLGDETVTIRPKKGKYLTIPIGEALTAAGVLKGEYAGGLRSIDGGFFFESKGQLLFGIRKGKTSRARVRPLFVLKREVTVHGTGALTDGVNESLDQVTDAIERNIDNKLGT